ncbi:MAG: hypothetical protein EZS28_024997, partial [Streblomastix strix]
MSGFNQEGALIGLPAGSFTMDGLTNAGNFFMSSFNQGGKLESLPNGSFNTEDITTVGNGFFMNFNNTGALLSLPNGSFKLNNILTANTDFFTSFNEDGALTSLPIGSFNTDAITQVVGSFFLNFNKGGGIAKNYDGVSIQNVSNAPIDAYYSSVNEVVESVPVGGYMRYDDAVLPPFVNKIEFIINNTGSYTIANKWATAITYKINNDQKITILPSATTTVSLTAVDHLVISETVEGDFKSWTSLAQPILKCSDYTNTADVISMPDMQVFCEGGSGITGPYFFSNFNNTGCIRSFPAGSFNTSIITEFDNDAFSYFNYNSLTLIQLPAGSFNLTNATWVDNNFCTYFNGKGGLTSLPAGSFKTDNIIPEETTNAMFKGFNYLGVLGSLPVGSFNFTAYNAVGSGFCESFNYQGALTQLPVGSFNTSSILKVGASFFSAFNQNGKLVTLPIDSFKLNFISNAPTLFFSTFNENGDLVSLPVGSFNTSFITAASSNFFIGFNAYGKLSSLPDGSFNLNALTTVGTNCFREFNSNGLLTQLPVNSFSFSALTTFGNNFLDQFNEGGSLTSLPVNSFNLSAVVNTGLGLNGFMLNFNSAGKITKNTQGVLIKNWTAGNLNAFYWNGTSSDTEVVAAGGYAGYDNGTAPSEPLFMQVLINNTGSYTLTNIWSSTLRYQINTATAIGIGTGTSATLTLQAGDTVKLSEINGGEFKLWNSNNGRCLIKSDTGLQNTVDLISIPAMNDFCVYNSAQNKLESNPNFFRGFNNGGALRSLPAGSFNTSNIQMEYGGFFTDFNRNGGLLQLPVGSFRLNNLSTISSNFFSGFNQQGALTSLPAGSFNLSTHISVEDSYFSAFNSYGALDHLPEGSFDIRNIVSIMTQTGIGFFDHFNNGGALTELPAGSFRTSGIQNAGNGFFAAFNEDGNLTSLPVGSFSLNTVTACGNSFFANFNYSGDIAALPTGSFSFPNLTNPGDTFFNNFNLQGLLPMGDDVRIRNATTAPITFYYYDEGDYKSTSVIAGNTMGYTDGSVVTRETIIMQSVGTALTQITNKWNTPIEYKVNAGLYNTLAVGEAASLTDFETVTVREKVEGDFRSWANMDQGLFTKGNDVIITKMPPINRFTTDTAGTIAGDNFFYAFNHEGNIISVPGTSFMTDTLVTVGENFLAYFNYSGSLTEFPEHALNITGITEAPDGFCQAFNSYGGLYTVPQNLIKFGNLTVVYNNFFADFWSYTTIPQGVMRDDGFMMDNIFTVGGNFFMDFNREGALTQLPANGFNTENIMSSMINFFAGFNRAGKITNLRTGSFLLDNLHRTGDNFFAGFNCDGGQIPRNKQGVPILNVANYVITACYWQVNKTVTEQIEQGAYSMYNNEIGPAPEDEYILAHITQSSDYTITNQWTTPINISINDATPTTIAGSGSVLYTLAANDEVKIIPITDTTFRGWRTGTRVGLFTHAVKTNTISITVMPPITSFTIDTEGTTADNGFFRYFNAGNATSFGVINSFPEDSFDTSTITD